MAPASPKEKPGASQGARQFSGDLDDNAGSGDEP